MTGRATLARWVFRMFVAGAVVAGAAQLTTTASAGERLPNRSMSCTQPECDLSCKALHGPHAIGTCERGDFPPYCLCEY
jgi:hypothetical protein